MVTVCALHSVPSSALGNIWSRAQYILMRLTGFNDQREISVFSTGAFDLDKTPASYHSIETGRNRPVKLNTQKIPVHF